MRCPACDEKIPNDSKECPECGERIRRKKMGADKFIPTKNLPALIGYYVGVAALIPYIALALGPVAILLGVVGIVYGVKNPKATAIGHCITAIVLSILGLIGTVVMIYCVREGYLESPMKLLKGGGGK